MASEKEISAAADLLKERNEAYVYKQREVWREHNRKRWAEGRGTDTPQMDARVANLNREAEDLRTEIRGAEKILAAMGILDAVLDKAGVPK